MPHDGSILIDGAASDLSSPRAAVRAGVGLLARDRTEESIASALAVRENAYLNPSASGDAAINFKGREASRRFEPASSGTSSLNLSVASVSSNEVPALKSSPPNNLRQLMLAARYYNF